MSTESGVVQIYAEVGGFPNAQYIRSPVSKEPHYVSGLILCNI